MIISIIKHIVIPLTKSLIIAIIKTYMKSQQEEKEKADKKSKKKGEAEREKAEKKMQKKDEAIKEKSQKKVAKAEKNIKEEEKKEQKTNKNKGGKK